MLNQNVNLTLKKDLVMLDQNQSSQESQHVDLKLKTSKLETLKSDSISKLIELKENMEQNK